MIKLEKEDILKIVEEEDIQITRLLYIDNDGIIRGYSSKKESLESAVNQGFCIASGMPYFTAFDELVDGSNLGAVGEFRIVPDLDTFKVLPYARKNAALICDIKEQTLEDSGVCARTILKNIIEDSEFEPYAAFENEFYFLKHDEQGELQPADNSICYTTKGMNEMNEITLDVLEALDKQNIEIEKYHPEYGPGQQEYCLKYDKILNMADKQIFFRDTIRGIAEKHDLISTFMPKPFNGLAGSGAHINLSLWKNGENIFYDENDAHALSETAYYFIGGVLKHIKAVCAFTASTITSYKRLQPHNWASAYVCYGHNNREAAVRIPSTDFNRQMQSKDSTRIEFKPNDPSSNPYLALAAVLTAGLDGIKNKIDPGESVEIDPSNLSEEEKETKNVSSLPRDLSRALDALEEDKLFREVFGETMISEYLKMKRQDWSDFMNHVTSWEKDKYVEIF